MRYRNLLLLIMLFIIRAANAQIIDSSSVSEKITAKAIWGPGMEMMNAIHDSCDSMKYPTFGECFIVQMKKIGASSEALEFSKLTGSEGFMRDFKVTGSVDVAYSVYPFRANENQVCFLVNGSPNMIDIDNFDYISKVNIKTNLIYKQIVKEFPNVSIWPGDRSGTDYPAIRNLNDGGKQFIFNYRLQDGCHACKLIGFAYLCFTFSKDDTLSGIKVIDVLKLTSSGKGVKVNGEYSNPGKIIKIKAGKCFTIALNSNATTGYSWKTEKPADEKIISNIGKIYLPPESSAPGAGGKEIWSFTGNSPGTTEISFLYQRPWEKGINPAKKTVFKIIVE